MKHKNQPLSPKQALMKAVKSFVAIIPMILAVILLVGLLQTYITPEMLTKLFGYSIASDVATGTLFGAISSGNPVMSYIIGKELLDHNVTLYAVTAFILSWVTLGIVQLPAEVSVFGIRFTVYKNILTLISTMLIAVVTVLTMELIA